MAGLLVLTILEFAATLLLSVLGFKCLLLRRDTLANEELETIGVRRLQLSYATLHADAEALVADSGRRSETSASVLGAPATVHSAKLARCVLTDDRCWCYIWTTLLGVAYCTITLAIAMFWYDRDGYGVFEHRSIDIGESIIASMGFSAVISLVFSLRSDSSFGRLWLAGYLVWIGVIWLLGLTYTILLYYTPRAHLSYLSVPISVANAAACVLRALTLPIALRASRLRMVLFALALASLARGSLAIGPVQEAAAEHLHVQLLWTLVEVATAAPLALGILLLHWR